MLVARYFAHGWIDQQFHEPAHFFSWFPWIRPWPRPWMHVHFAALGALAVLIAAGVFYRPSCALFCLGFTYVHLIDKTNYLNHYYLISLLTGLMAFLPLDRPGPAPAWSAWVLRFQVGLVYFFAGVAKLQEDWLLRAQPLRLWLADVPFLGEPWMAYAASWGAALFDLSLPFLLLARATRPWALGAAVLFHVATALLFPIGLFPWVMIVCLLVFLPGRVEPVPLRAWARPALAAYALVQIAVPLRFLAYPGDVLWTEAGFRFSWRVMVAEKRGDARFFARDRSTGRQEEVPVRAYLTPVQAHYMAGQPDMIRDFARLAREDYARKGRDVEVRAEAWISVNGRPSRALEGPPLRLDVSRSNVKPAR